MDPPAPARICGREIAGVPAGFFNVYAQGARQLLKDFPIVKPVSGKRTLAPHLLVIGLGRLGEQLVIHSARQWVPFHEETGLKLQISVVDPNAQRKIEGLCQDYSLIERTCDFEIHPIDSNSPGIPPDEIFLTVRGIKLASLTSSFVWKMRQSV